MLTTNKKQSCPIGYGEKGKRMNKYKVVDDYELEWEFIGYANSLMEVKQIAKRRYADTYGECAIYYYPLNEATQKYEKRKAVFLERF